MSNMANTGNFSVMNAASSMNSLFFEDFLDYIEWATDEEEAQPVFVADDVRHWSEFYEHMVSGTYLAEFGGMLTALLDSFLEYDEVNGNLSSGEHLDLFNIGQAKIARALVRCDLRVDAKCGLLMNVDEEHVSHLTKYLELHARRTVAKADWDEFSSAVVRLIHETQMFRGHSDRKLGYHAINNRLRVLEVPYRIRRTDNGYTVVPEEDTEEEAWAL